jgi:hypothetical protein
VTHGIPRPLSDCFPLPLRNRRHDVQHQPPRCCSCVQRFRHAHQRNTPAVESLKEFGKILHAPGVAVQLRNDNGIRRVSIHERASGLFICYRSVRTLHDLAHRPEFFVIWPLIASTVIKTFVAAAKFTYGRRLESRPDRRRQARRSGHSLRRRRFRCFIPEPVRSAALKIDCCGFTGIAGEDADRCHMRLCDLYNMA